MTRNSMPQSIRPPLLLLMTLLLAACGFHLRGAVELPAGFERLAIVGLTEGDTLYRALASGLRASGVEVVPANEGVAVLRIANRQSERNVLSVGSDGRVREYGLVESFRARLERGDQAGAWRVFRAERSLIYDPNDVLGKQAEEAQIRREMMRDLAMELMMALPEMAVGQNGK